MPIGIGRCYRADCAASYLLSVVLFFSCPLWAVEQPVLQIKNAWVQLAPPGAVANAAYMDLYNPGDKPVVINRLNSPCCAGVMLHRTFYKNDRVMMEHLDEIVIPENGHLQLKPGGLHVMLLRASPSLEKNNQIEIHIGYADGQEQIIYVPVKANNDE